MPQHGSRNRFIARASAGLLAAGLLCGLAGPASAATTVSISAPSVALINSQVWIQGAVSGSSVGATVRILKYTSGAWNVAGQGTVNSQKKYAIKVTVTSGGNKFLAKAYGPNIATGYSKSVNVYGLTDRSMIVYKTNEYRAKNGKPALKQLSSLNNVAQGWSQHMADTIPGQVATLPHHVPPNDPHHYSAHYSGAWTFAAENVAAGYTPITVVNAWINSPGHRANLLCDCTHIGVGYVNKPATYYDTFFTQNFAKY